MRYDKHNVLVFDPHPQSLAALVLLTKKLAPRPLGYKVWLKYRGWFLRQHWRIYKEFRCHYCKKTGLKSQSDVPAELATLDHVQPLAKGGLKFHSSNIVVACSPCNNRKQDKSVEEFLNLSV
jgi:5-methylcytosine-specific restriction endonuclease McrA